MSPALAGRLSMTAPPGKPLIFFWFYVYLSLVFSACYHWWICLLVWLLSSFFFLFSLFVSVCVYVSLCDIVCLGLLSLVPHWSLPLLLGIVQPWLVSYLNISNQPGTKSFELELLVI